MLSNHKDQSRLERELEMARKQAADYAMALDLLSKITQSGSETEAVNNILEIFTVLFSPKKLSYLPIRENTSGPPNASTLSGENSEAMRHFANDIGKKYSWIASEQGFRVKITHKGNLLGILEVDEILFPEYKESYLNLCLSMADVCGLALENAHQYRQLKENECRLGEEKEKLEEALTQVKQLNGLLPICMYCKKIRDDTGYWNQLEVYIHDHSDAEFSHSICKECMEKYYPDVDMDDD